MAADRAQQKQVMKDIILGLHRGVSVEEAKARFEKEVGNVSSSEIAEMEQSLIDEGLSTDEIKKFCNVHALLFQSALEKAPSDETFPSHPVYLFKMENREIEKLVDSIKKAVEKPEQQGLAALKKTLKELLLRLRDIDIHYQRKEHLLFPFLEKAGFMGPSKVMWGKHNEIRGMLKAAVDGLDAVTSIAEFDKYRGSTLAPLLEEVPGMVFKEENILFPASLEKLQASDWVEILRESDDIGYVFIKKPEETEVLMKRLQAALLEEALYREQDSSLQLPTGAIRLNELLPLLNALPVDLTFVDKDDRVAYFSDSKDRKFRRTKSVIGRTVQNCHPPQSLEAVEKILRSFKEGKKDQHAFWITLRGRMVHIRYFAIRDPKGQYLGALEVTQDITDIKNLEGEKRLLDERD
ncbi:MAG: DUF438 domain-containing protein [Dehalococcoidia bacterium]|nr:DUF438 domain-containing protein [Dehalococcoidia bacterium]